MKTTYYIVWSCACDISALSTNSPTASNTAMQRQTAVTAHFSSEQLLLSAFAWHHDVRNVTSGAGPENTIY